MIPILQRKEVSQGQLPRGYLVVHGAISNLEIELVIILFLE